MNHDPGKFQNDKSELIVTKTDRKVKCLMNSLDLLRINYYH